MSFLHSKQRIWLDLAVGVFLLSLLGFGFAWIYELNEDAREVQLTSAHAMQGQELSRSYGCIACHTVDGSVGVGPSWKDMWGAERLLSNGDTVVVNEDYFRRSLRFPASQLVAGYPNVMLPYFLEEAEIAALIAFAQSLSEPM